MSRTLVILAVVAFVLAGCGNKNELVREADTEGTYLDVGGLTYQIQLSRFLNPGDVEDKQYLEGLPEGISPQLPGDETWFGVWMRVKNYSDEALTPTFNFTLRDTEGNEYRPIPLAAYNPFKYEPIKLFHSQVLPTPDTAAASGPIQGSLILFRLKVASLQNRPIQLEIAPGGTEPGIIDIDL